MTAKAFIVLCASAILVQSAQSICAGKLGYKGLKGCAGVGYYNGLLAPALAYEGFAPAVGCGCGTGVASTGGGLSVASASSASPVGVSVLSENIYEGSLTAGGNLPFLGTVAVEGVLPTAGAGAVSYGCGDGDAVTIGSEGPNFTGITIPGAVFPPSTTSPIATADSLALVSGYKKKGAKKYGLGKKGYGKGYKTGYGCGAML